MNRPPAPFSTRSRNNGTTLIEVLAGLLILGTLLASVMIARGRFARQLSEADHRAAAVRAIDAQLTTWMAGPRQNIPLGRDGPLADLPGTYWRTRAVRDASADRLGALVVHVDVIDCRPGSQREQLLFSVEFLLHDDRTQVKE